MIYSFKGKSPKIGKGTYIYPNAAVIGDVTLGENCYVGPGAVIRGDYGTIIIGNENAIEDNMVIHAQPGETVTIGSNNIFGHGVIIHCHKMGSRCLIGMGAVLSIGSEIGDECIVAEGSVVKNRQILEDGVMVAGTPAKVIRKTRPQEVESTLYGTHNNYSVLAAEHLEGALQEVK